MRRDGGCKEGERRATVGNGGNGGDGGGNKQSRPLWQAYARRKIDVEAVIALRYCARKCSALNAL